jgi:chromosome segregation ATPase
MDEPATWLSVAVGSIGAISALFAIFRLRESREHALTEAMLKRVSDLEAKESERASQLVTMAGQVTQAHQSMAALQGEFTALQAKFRETQWDLERAQDTIEKLEKVRRELDGHNRSLHRELQDIYRQLTSGVGIQGAKTLPPGPPDMEER